MAVEPTLPIVAELPRPRMSRSGQWLSTFGQFISYAGIGLITCGSVLVIWSHYGGPANFAPTGWLINALGQMLFFLGLVNLVSGGLEQTSVDLRDQIAQLHAKHLRADVAHPTETLSGPHFGRRRTARRRDAA